MSIRLLDCSTSLDMELVLVVQVDMADIQVVLVLRTVDTDTVQAMDRLYLNQSEMLLIIRVQMTHRQILFHRNPSRLLHQCQCVMVKATW